MNVDKMKIISLGGLGEIGKNLTVFETKNDIIIIDCGVSFPDSSQLGVDLVIPDTSYLDNKYNKIRGIVVTHGHEDHIGGIPYFLKKYNVPVYGTRLTLGILEHKLAEHKIKSKTKTHIVKSGQTIKLGNDFEIEFIKVNHSIAGAVGLGIKTPVGTIVHTGDFKIDYTPTSGDIINLSKFSEYGNNGVKLLLMDSTNAEREGNTKSESAVAKTLLKLFEKYENKRIVISTFASNMYRVQSIIDAAIKTNRKISLAGKSMLRVIDICMELGYIKIPEGKLVEIEDVNNYLPEEICIITTGSQGEPMSGLYRMAFGEHKEVRLDEDDVVILSSHTIPGNEMLVNAIINKLCEKNIEIAFDSNTSDIHVSGHACQNELKLMLSLVKPEFFMPVHGEARHLIASKKMAMEMGIPEENIIVSKIGRVVEVDKNSVTLGGEVASGEILIDGNGVGDIGNVVLKDRKILSQDGIIIAVITLNMRTKKMMIEPDIISRGFVYVKESDELTSKIQQITKKEVTECIDKGINEWAAIKTNVKDAISKYVYNKTKRNPMILPIIINVK